MADEIQCEHLNADGSRCDRTSKTRSLFNAGVGNFCAEHFGGPDNIARQAAGDANAPA
jgi:hypothetical protein